MAAANYNNADGLNEADDDDYRLSQLDQASDVEYDDDDDLNANDLARKRRRSSLARGGKRTYAAAAANTQIPNQRDPRKQQRKSIQFAAAAAAATTSHKAECEAAPTRQQNRRLAARVDQICEFVHVLLHCLLYKINYYDKKTHFEKLLKYNVIVYKCKSDIVCEYITNCVECFRLIMYKNYNLSESGAESSKTPPSTTSIALAILKNDSDEESALNLLIKRYTLHIENLLEAEINSDDEGENAGAKKEADDSAPALSNRTLNEFRDAILKCLYAKDINYSTLSFKWQIQLRSSNQRMNQLNNEEDLFKLFAWRQCDKEEITSISVYDDAKTGTGASQTRSRRSNSSSGKTNQLCVRPVKTFNSLERQCKFRLQLFIEKPQKSLGDLK